MGTNSAVTRYVAVVDGEHYPPVVAAALRAVSASGGEVAGAVLAGGTEKLAANETPDYGGTEVAVGDDTAAVLDDAIARWRPDAVLDLSDEPVLDYRKRHLLASVALFRGVAYEGAGFRFEPPPRPRLCGHPSLAVIGTGKRTGKTAVAGFAARRLTAGGRKPVIVAMGRGGPPDPEVLRGDELELQPADLLALADEGAHAASDYVEDALLGRVPTVGCRRCGGGLAGAVAHSNVAAGIAAANELGGDFLILEGSGAAVPPAHADATCLIVPAHVDPEHLTGYMGPYRLLLADCVVVTMCEDPFGTSPEVSDIVRVIRAAWRERMISDGREEIRVVRTVFRPTPVRSVEGARAVVATTAPTAVGDSIRRHLESQQGCKVIGMTHSLSDRAALSDELEAGIGGADVLLCEIKAAGVDVATRRALEAGVDVVYMDNVPVAVEDDDIDAMFDWVADAATRRFGGRRNG